MSVPNFTVSSSSARRPMCWRLRHSVWLLAPILGFGVLSCIGFIYCAIRVRSIRWIIVAGSATCASILAVALDILWGDSAGDPSGASISFTLMWWLVSVIFGFVINRDYLQWRSTGVDPMAKHQTAPAWPNGSPGY